MSRIKNKIMHLRSTQPVLISCAKMHDSGEYVAESEISKNRTFLDFSVNI